MLIHKNMTTDPDSPDTFAARLQRFMEVKGLNQTTLSKKSGIDRSTINRMLKGTRHPQPFEIGLLAQCFDAAPEDLMSGVRLPPQVQRAVDKERERTEQLLAAEAARDEAVARAAQLDAEVDRLQRERERDQADARKARETADAEWNGRLHELERAHAAKEKTSDTTNRNLKGMLERAATKMRQDDATQLVLRSQIQALQQQLAQERSAKASAGMVGGLLGIALGRAMD
jgi:transcriptional regulator with XRE-family HTH domain